MGYNLRTPTVDGCDILHHQQDGVSTCCSSRPKWVVYIRLPSSIKYHHQLSSSIINYHHLSSIIIYHLSSIIINYHHLFNHPQYMIYTMVPLRYPPGSQLDHSRKRCAGCLVGCPGWEMGPDRSKVDEDLTLIRLVSIICVL